MGREEGRGREGVEREGGVRGEKEGGREGKEGEVGTKAIMIYNHIHGTHSSEGKKDQRPCSNLRCIVEFQPRKPRRPVEILRPPSLLCTGHRCAAIQRHLRPAPRGWYCVLCDGSRLSSA